jgi:L-threonylcarbamoyladenylate synthase
VVDVSGAEVRVLRPGGVTAVEIAAVLGVPVLRGLADDQSSPTAPGQLASHYAPRARLRLDALSIRPGEAFLTFGSGPPTTAGVINLSPTGDLLVAAAHLFAALRRLDASGVATIAVMPIPETGLGEAINDRLRRAAAPR